VKSIVGQSSLSKHPKAKPKNLYAGQEHARQGKDDDDYASNQVDSQVEEYENNGEGET